MPTQILMPALSPTMTEGTLAKWHVKTGDRVVAGDVIAEIETDKATMEVEAVDEGTIGDILIAEGSDHVPVNQPIALLLDDREEASSFETRPAAAPQDEDRGPQLDAAVPHPEEGALAPVSKGEAEITSAIRGEFAPQNEAGEKRNGHARVFASPLAKRLAKERGIDLGGVSGSGPHGRIVLRDIADARHAASSERAGNGKDTASVAEPIQSRELVRQQRQISPPALPQGLSDDAILAAYEPGSYELVPHDTMRRVIGERLTLAKQTIPHFYLSIDCELDATLAARERLNALAPKEGPRRFKLSVNDFVIKAMAMALQKTPAANATWTSRGLLRHRASDIAVAVALEGGGLFTPVLRNCEVKSLSEISNEMKDLAARARSKRLAPHEYQGGSTAISNLGMYGITKFDAVINPPQASILAVGKAEKRPVIKQDAIKIATMMSVTLSVDHRVIDGALGAELLAGFKAFIEDPVTMLV